MSLENFNKLDLLSRYSKDYSVFVETGTAGAVTSIAAGEIFDAVYTIELNFDFYISAIEKTYGISNVFPLYGDSSIVLGKILNAIDKPCIILLDAHFVGDGVIGVSGHTPVEDELEAIFPSYKETHYKHIVLVDDIRLFGEDENYPTVEFLQNFCKKIGYKYFIENDIMVMHP